MTAYYNEIEPYCTAWLQNLMDAEEIALGTIDDRSILDVTPEDLAGYDRCHFFAGIAGWDYALKLAHFPEHLPVWTGSCPCQPFSSAGRGSGGADERHLWPAWFWLIQQCRPPIIFGEQVASKAGLAWLDVVFSDLEAAGYSCGAVDLCAASKGAWHQRQRLWFVAISKGIRLVQNEIQYRADSQGDFWFPCELSTILDNQKIWLVAHDKLLRVSDGIPYHMGAYKAYGNAIVPQVAATFIQTVMEIMGD